MNGIKKIIYRIIVLHMRKSSTSHNQLRHDPKVLTSREGRHEVLIISFREYIILSLIE